MGRSTATARCIKVDIKNGLDVHEDRVGLADSLDEFGMGFSTDTAGGSTDTLFVSGGPDSSPARRRQRRRSRRSISPTSPRRRSARSLARPSSPAPASAELWGWFPDASAPRIEKLDKTNGSALTTYQSSLSSLAGTPMDWAFAFYGGDFWVFLERDTDSATTVYQVDGMTGSISRPHRHRLAHDRRRRRLDLRADRHPVATAPGALLRCCVQRGIVSRITA